MDIPHPLISDCPSTDKLNSSHLLILTTTTSTDITHPLIFSTPPDIYKIITNTDDLVVVQSLLGLREGSDMSERLGCSQEKGDEKSEHMNAICSSMAKVSERSPTLDGEGEGVRVVNQGEPLMQKEQEHERKEGTGVIRMEAIAIGDDFKYDLSNSFGGGSHGKDTDEVGMDLGGAAVKKDINDKIDVKLSESTIMDIHQKLRKDNDLDKKVEALGSKMTAVENSVAKILSNQEAQTQLL
ncbi:hypothetical protein AgCh_016339 [Apium graveolens]